MDSDISCHLSMWIHRVIAMYASSTTNNMLLPFLEKFLISYGDLVGTTV
jgi:hypothetical protein